MVALVGGLLDGGGVPKEGHGCLKGGVGLTGVGGDVVGVDLMGVLDSTM